MASKYTSGSAFTALIIAFLLHNIEEAYTICSFPVQSPVEFIQPASCIQFIWAVTFLSVVALVVFMTAMKTKNVSVYNFISTGLSAVLLFNALIPHLIVGLYTLSYTPGLLSAVLLNLPLSAVVLIKNRPVYHSGTKFFRHIFIFLIFGYILFIITMGLVKSFV